MNAPIKYIPNPALAWVYRRLFRNIAVDDTWASRVRAAESKGTVVYVLRNLSFVDFFALDHLTKRYELPEVKFANDLGLGVLEPMGKGWLNALRPKTKLDEEELFEAAIRGGASAALFLMRPPDLLDATARGKLEGDNFLRTLIKLQPQVKDPILLMPQVFVWSKEYDTIPTPFDQFLGPREWPGRARSLAQALSNLDNVTMRAGDPVNLREELANRSGDESDELFIRRLRSLVLRRIERERRAVLGPLKKSPERAREQILKSSKLQATIHDLAGDNAAEETKLQAKALSMLDELSADPHISYVATFGGAINKGLPLIFSDLQFDHVGLERIRDLMKQGPVIFLPSHRSHFDYLILSYALFTHHLQVPVICAGDNLNFFPLGTIFRRAGAFFIRRSFRGDRLYSAVVDAYLRRLIMDGWSIEFFIEGGRSRTGKLLSPKLGMLSVVVSAALEVSRTVTFLPVSISYERLFEEKSYANELLGGEKKKEDVSSVLGAARYLRERYGTISVQFGEPLTLASIYEQTEGKPFNPETISAPKRRALIQRLAYRTMNEINRVTAVTAGALVAAALLTTDQPGLSYDDLSSTVSLLAQLLNKWGARFAADTYDEAEGSVRPERIRAACELFVRASHVQVRLPGKNLAGKDALSIARQNPDVIFSVPSDRRVYLDLPRNLMLHFFVARGVVAAAMCFAVTLIDDLDLPVDLVRERTQTLSRLLKFEFQFRADAPFESIFNETKEQMIADGELLEHEGRLRPGTGLGRKRLLIHFNMIRAYLEGYRISAKALDNVAKGPLSAREFAKRALVDGEELFLSGRISRREAISRSTFENATEAFVDLGYLRREEGKLRLVEAYEDKTARTNLETTIGAWSTFRGTPG